LQRIIHFGHHLIPLQDQKGNHCFGLIIQSKRKSLEPAGKISKLETEGVTK